MLSGKTDAIRGFPTGACLVMGIGIIVGFTTFVFSQTATTGRITGTVTDPQGAIIAGATVAVENPTTGENRSGATDESGSFSVLELLPAHYNVSIQASGFRAAKFVDVNVGPAETLRLNAILQVAEGNVSINVNDLPPRVQSDSAGLRSTLNTVSLEALPLPTRNFLQLLTLTPGVSAPLTNNNAMGRNSPNVSVNGLRVTQNNYQINGIDAGDTSLHVFADVAVPSPETINEVMVQTSLYDASVKGGGASVQVVTKNGTNFLHGGGWEYFRNEAFNANDANLKPVNVGRPVMRRNVYGVTLGGPLRKNKAFFFGSYQGTRDTNGATDQSLYKSVFIAPGLTTDRSAGTLMSTFGVSSIDPISLSLLNFKLPNDRFLIPTPQTSDGLVSGTAPSKYHEEQFSADIDYYATVKDWIGGKFFFAHSPLFSALAGSNFGTSSALPGFGTTINVDNRVFSLQETHSFNAAALNEIRLGYSFLRHDEVPQEALYDCSLGIQRSTAQQFPGLPLILFGRDEGGASIGTSDITYRGNIPSVSIADTVSLQRGQHYLRVGGEIWHAEWRARAAIFSYGEIEFPTFRDFLVGNTGVSFDSLAAGFAHLGTGLTSRDFITTDYDFFVEDDWKASPNLTINLGLRYELDPFPYDSQGRVGGFDPALYRPRMDLEGNVPLGPPAEGITEAGNALPQYSLPGVTRVGKRMVKSIDANNFGPRVGLAWMPSASRHLALRAGYGIFYSRPSFIYLGVEYFAPPFFLDSVTSGQPFSNPFLTAPPDGSFPLILPGSSVAATVIDPNARTPYVQQFSASGQYEMRPNTMLQIAYVGTRGIKLFRAIGINQARIASLDHPVPNAVTGESTTVNTNDNAALRAPLQGVDTGLFALNKSAAQSSYDSLQLSLNRPLSHGLQFSFAYTFAKSIDNASNPGGGANSDGNLDRSGGLDSSGVWGDQLSPRANRGLSDFDRTHYFALQGIWQLPVPGPLRSTMARRLAFADWQLSGIVSIMSGLPVDVIDPTGGSLYGLLGARPNWAPGANRSTAVHDVPSGCYFNPAAFSQAIVEVNEPIPSAHNPTALAGDAGTDIGNVGRNVLRGPRQSNLDVAVGKHFAASESKAIELRADFFNLLNHANRNNPISDITSPGFGRALSFSSSPRMVQFVLKFTL